VVRSPLSETHQAVIDFERRWLVDAGGPKAAAIRDRLGISPRHYYGILEELVDSPDARAYDPLVIGRLRRRREERRRRRITGGDPRASRPR